MTPIDLIRYSLLATGITLPQSIYAEDVNQAFDHLNMMVAAWNRSRLLVYSEIDVYFTSTGAVSYSIGPGADIDTVRPDKLEAAYLRILNPNPGPNTIDISLAVIQAREDYAAIPTKNIVGFPAVVWYDSAYPIGRIYVNPVGQAGNYEFHLILKNQLTGFSDLTTDIALPPEYVDALMWNLAVRLMPAPTANVMTQASRSLRVLRAANDQWPNNRIQYGLPGMSRGLYPWYQGVAGLPY